MPQNVASTLLRRCRSKALTPPRSYSSNAFVSLPPSVELSPPDNDWSPHNSVAGKRIAVKDNICTIDFPTTCASGILRGFVSPYDATIVKKLKEQGAILCGKTNMDEFGMGSHSIHSTFGPVVNLGRDGKAYSAGGSSGGSAMAVKEGQCWA